MYVEVGVNDTGDNKPMRRYWQENPMRIFIGTSANGEDAEAEMALEYSLRENIENKEVWGNVQIEWIRQTNDENSFWHGFNDVNWRTPYDGFKWAIPEYCNYEGRAIYLDVNMINLFDITRLWVLDLPDFCMLATRDGGEWNVRDTSVIVFNNWKWNPEDPKNKAVLPPKEEWKDIYNFDEQIFRLMDNGLESFKISSLDPRWNSVDGDTLSTFAVPSEWYPEGHDKREYNVNYKEMATRPWKPSWYTGQFDSHHDPEMEEVFHAMVEEAKENGYKLEDYQIDRGVTYRCIGR